MHIQINVTDLKKIVFLVLNKLDEGGIENITIQMDEYWNIPTDEWSSMEEIKPVLGLLSDDWGSLLKVLNGDNIATYLDFERLAAILRAISETIIPTV